jgi:hypothetical protein
MEALTLMPSRGPFKKDLTAIGRGGIRKFTGKGAREQSRSGFGGLESLTGGNPFSSMANNYPKPAPEDLGSSGTPSAPMGSASPQLPTAMMPGGAPTDDEVA